MGIETLLSAGLGVAGLLQNRDQGNSRDRAMGDANALNWEALNMQKDLFDRFSNPALTKLLGLAEGYDPIAESRASTDYASTVAQDAIGRALRGFNTNYLAGGGTSGNSSLEGAQKAAVMKPIAQQLAGIVADATSNATAKKMGAYQSVLGQAPAGGLSNAYFSAADSMGRMAQGMPGADYGASSNLLADALKKLFGGGSAGGGFGSGVNRNNTRDNFYTGDFGMGGGM